MEINQIIADLTQKGFRITKPRKAIISIFLDSNTPLSVNELRSILKQKKVISDKVTAYRNVEFLVDNGLLNRVVFPDNVVRYELTSLPHHHHLVCLKCKKITHTEQRNLEKKMSEIEKTLAKTNRFKVVDHNLEFYGFCSNCA